MNGNTTGVLPTVELAGANNSYPYPVYPMMGGFGNSGFGGNDGAIWIILIIALLGGFGNNGNNGFSGYNNNNDFAWLSNGQKDIMTNTNNGFDTLHLSNQLDTVNSGIYSLSNQLCNVGNDITSAINTTAYNAEISANNRQMANMNQNFALSQQLSNASADNRLGIANLGSDIAREACATRTSDTQNTQTLLSAITGGIQSIKDEIFRDRIDEKDSKIAELNRQLSMKDLQASQVAQNAFISQGFANEVDQLYNRLANCPVPSTPVYGRTPIFTCPQNNGCGCGFNTTSQFI